MPADVSGTLWQVDTSSARATGLRSRPVEESVRDLWAWLRERPGPATSGGRARPDPGLPADVERALLTHG
jgi:hypothetical protein